MTGMKQKIVPNLWFDRQAEEAANLYASTFKNSRVGAVVRAGKAGSDVTGLSEGTVMTVEFELGGQKFVGINGGPLFKFTPAISFQVSCDTVQEVDAIWNKLFPGGSALMEIGSYPFSERYGWLQDKYGLSWQVMYTGGRKIQQMITPTLMFVGKQTGKTEAALKLYASIFHDAAIGDIMRYGKGEEPDKEGTVRHAGFTLEGQQFAAMDSALEHKFTFNEAVSLMVECQDQKEIDYYWDKLTADGGEESMCGWLKDKFGVSWQVAPPLLGQMLSDPDPAKVARVTNAFLKMHKLIIADLQKAYRGA